MTIIINFNNNINFTHRCMNKKVCCIPTNFIKCLLKIKISKKFFYAGLNIIFLPLNY